MEDQELDQLLKDYIGKDYAVPDNLDRKTRLKMNRTNEKKEYRLISLLISLAVIVTGLSFASLLRFFPDHSYKSIIGIIALSFLNILLLLYVINYQTHKIMETEL